MSTADLSAAETRSLFSHLDNSSSLVLAVSGGPDSTALMLLAALWLKMIKGRAKPKLTAVTVDHMLRKESKTEALAVGKLARKLGIKHVTLRWIGKKPATGLQQAARQARYKLLVGAARKAKATHILTAHTLDDQAETVLIRMARGSGLTGLRAMARQSALDGLVLVRPLLGIPKERLVATLRAAGIRYAEDPSNLDPKFTRVRMRELMPVLAREGLDSRRLARLAQRLRRADTAIEAATDIAMAELSAGSAPGVPLSFDAAKFAALPAEIGLRVLGRTIARLGAEGPVELGKLEALKGALDTENPATARFRRTLAGAMVTLAGGRVSVERAPERRTSAESPQKRTLTKPARAKATRKKRR